MAKNVAEIKDVYARLEMIGSLLERVFVLLKTAHQDAPRYGADIKKQFDALAKELYDIEIRK